MLYRGKSITFGSVYGASCLRILLCKDWDIRPKKARINLEIKNLRSFCNLRRPFVSVTWDFTVLAGLGQFFRIPNMTFKKTRFREIFPYLKSLLRPVLWIRIRMDPELLFRIQLNMKEQISKNVISLWILDFVYCRTVVWNRKWQIVDRFFFLIEFKVVLFTISKYT